MADHVLSKYYKYCQGHTCVRREKKNNKKKIKKKKTLVNLDQLMSFLKLLLLHCVLAICYPIGLQVFRAYLHGSWSPR